MGNIWSNLWKNDNQESKQSEKDNLKNKQEEIDKLIAEKKELRDKLTAENKELREQNTELRENRVPLDAPWKTFGYEVFTDETKTKLYEDIESVKLSDKCESIKVLVVGDAGSGKSSFVNTLKTVFRNSDQIANVAPSYGTNYESTTRTLHEIILKTFDSGRHLLINDCRGIPKDATEKAIYEKDLKSIIKGHIKKNYEFRTDREIQNNDGFYRENPTVSTIMHCVLLVVNADMLDKRSDFSTLKNIQLYLAEKNIPLQLILTKMDKLDLCGLGDCSGIFKSRHAYKKVQLAKSIFGVHDSQILPIANYVDETRRSDIKDILALQAILNILHEAVTYIENI